MNSPSVTAYLEGQQAARDGKESNDCPFDHDGLSANKWMEGFTEEIKFMDTVEHDKKPLTQAEAFDQLVGQFNEVAVDLLKSLNGLFSALHTLHFPELPVQQSAMKTTPMTDQEVAVIRAPKKTPFQQGQDAAIACGFDPLKTKNPFAPSDNDKRVGGGRSLDCMKWEKGFKESVETHTTPCTGETSRTPFYRGQVAGHKCNGDRRQGRNPFSEGPGKARSEWEKGFDDACVNPEVNNE